MEVGVESRTSGSRTRSTKTLKAQPISNYKTVFGSAHS